MVFKYLVNSLVQGIIPLRFTLLPINFESEEFLRASITEETGIKYIRYIEEKSGRNLFIFYQETTPIGLGPDLGAINLLRLKLYYQHEDLSIPGMRQQTFLLLKCIDSPWTYLEDLKEILARFLYSSLVITKDEYESYIRRNIYDNSCENS